MSTALQTITCTELLGTDFEPTRFIVADILPQGLHILGGAPKIGKSWLVLHLCLAVATGEKLWDFDTTQGTVLYLSLEDSLVRLQERVEHIAAAPADKLQFAIMADSIANGLDKQIESFITSNPDTCLIAIDTLQRVRNTATDTNAYANDYKDIALLKAIADKHGVAILLVHHLRKSGDADPVNMISGTTGLTGAVDSVYVLRKEKRTGNRATFIATGRDIEDREFTVEFNKETLTWMFISDDSDGNTDGGEYDICIEKVYEYLKSEKILIGSASELSDKLFETQGYKILPMVLSRKLKQKQKLLAEKNITYKYHRTGQKREISLIFSSANDTNDGNDTCPAVQ